MWRIIENDWWYTLSNLPLLLLQGVAIIGIFCIILVFGRKEHDMRPYRINPGIALGVTGFVLTWLINESSMESMRLYIRIDLVFLGGLLGGVHGGIACLLLMVCGIVLFGGDARAHVLILDMTIIALVGIGLNRWLRTRSVERLTWRDINVILATRFLISIISPFIIWLLGVVTLQGAVGAVSKRVAGVSVSLLVLMGILSVLKWDVHQRKTRMRQHNTNRTDQLTGLPNRVALHEHLQQLTKKEVGQGSHTLILVEVANPGDLITLNGHLWGESFWKRLEQVLTQWFERPSLSEYQPRLFLFSDTLLAITLYGISVAEARRLNLLPALRNELDSELRQHVADGFLLPHLNYGVAELQSGSAISVEMAMRNLSLALHSDDQPIGYFTPSLAERVAQDERIRRLLMVWIETRAPPLYYQPKIELTTGRTLGAEALLRAHDENGENICPLRVLKVATQQQMLLKFEWSTIEAVVRDLRQCRSATGTLPLAVNVSSVSLSDPEFASRLICLLRSKSVKSESLLLELTEAIPVLELDSVRTNMMVLCKAGVRLSLDDFGTGYSALALLAQFPFNEVKIDHSMVSRLDQPRMRVAVSLALESAQRYNANLVAEGVETQRQLETLIQLGVRCGQGHLFSAAVPLSELVY